MIQFWDTSAFVSLFYEEPFTERAAAARGLAERRFAWDWLVLESWSAFVCRRSSERQRRARRSLLNRFAYLTLEPRHRTEMQRLIQRHRLRTADAGHLLCLKQARQLHRETVFVCCDTDLVAAARAERIRVWE
jgi:predicted nucleic acid-binding protein